MKTVLSYCLFDPFNIHAHRTWDEHNLDKTRYWFNIPALYVVNKILYPDYEMKIFHNDGLKMNPLFKMLENLDITLQQIDLSFDNTSEPMMWRLIPIWENYDCVFLRDIDSIPNRQEYNSTKYFETKDYAIQTLRSHENHYHEMGCDILGGLCGFKPDKIQAKPSSFQEYYDAKMNMPWAQDQLMLSKTFIHDQSPLFLETNFLDCPIDNQNRKAPFPHTVIPHSILKRSDSDLQKNMVLSIIDKYSLADWAGQPCDARGSALTELLNIECEATDQVKIVFENDDIKRFYGV